MTREEAIEILWRYDVNFEPHPPEEVMHAIDMAIESLSADTVSREHHDMEIKELKHQIKDQADLVSVVRCKDCIYWQSGDMGTGEAYEPYCEMLDTETDENAFCSDGERREE